MNPKESVYFQSNWKERKFSNLAFKVLHQLPFYRFSRKSLLWNFSQWGKTIFLRNYSITHFQLRSFRYTRATIVYCQKRKTWCSDVLSVLLEMEEIVCFHVKLENYFCAVCNLFQFQLSPRKDRQKNFQRKVAKFYCFFRKFFAKRKFLMENSLFMLFILCFFRMNNCSECKEHENPHSISM